MLEVVFLLFLPFCAVARLGLLGGFDANAVLLLFFPLFAWQVLTGQTKQALVSRAKGSSLVRRYLLVFLLAALFTPINGSLLLTPSSISNSYGMDPFRKSLVTSIVPLFIFAAFLSMYVLAMRLGRERFQKIIMISFWVVIAYTILQVSSKVVPASIYDALWPILEGSRDNDGLPYIERFNRINGVAHEPAEFSKLLLVYFLPWLVFPLDSKRRLLPIFITLGLGAATLSIIGIILALAAVVLIFMSRSSVSGSRLIVLAIFYVLLVFALLFAETTLQPYLSRLSALDEDQSTIIRFTYNVAAMQLALENFWIGLGWSNELFLFPERVAHISYLWEVRNDIATGNALTAKSLGLRLLMYFGFPLFAYFMYVTAKAFVFSGHEATRTDRARARFVFFMLVIASVIDGGILTSFFSWGILAFPLAFLNAAKVTPNPHVTPTPTVSEQTHETPAH